jgi:1-acyl-sn-glycerol-3-phosphate acyltransferase
MEFVLVVVLAVAIVMWRWRRKGRRLKEMVFFGGIRLYAQFWHRWSSSSASNEPLPAQGPVLLVTNHTCSADPMFLQAGCHRPLCWLASREHYEMHPVFRKVLDTLHSVPVRRNGQDAAAARGGLRRLQEGRVLAIFPEGNLSGVGKGRLCIPKAGAAWMALRSDTVVIPAYIAGGPQTHKLLASWALPSRRPVRVYFGKPIDLSRFRGQPITRRLVEQVSAYLMQEIGAVPKSAQKNEPRMEHG